MYDRRSTGAPRRPCNNTTSQSCRWSDGSQDREPSATPRQAPGPKTLRQRTSIVVVVQPSQKILALLPLKNRQLAHEHTSPPRSRNRYQALVAPLGPLRCKRSTLHHDRLPHPHANHFYTTTQLLVNNYQVQFVPHRNTPSHSTTIELRAERVYCMACGPEGGCIHWLRQGLRISTDTDAPATR